jgi:hypothetical protein
MNSELLMPETSISVESAAAVPDIGTQSREHPFVCDQCNHRFAKIDILTDHKRLHDEFDRFKAKQDARRGYKELNSRGPIITGTQSRKHLFACDKCIYRCARNDILIAHKRVHDDRFRSIFDRLKAKEDEIRRINELNAPRDVNMKSTDSSAALGISLEVSRIFG